MLAYNRLDGVPELTQESAKGSARGRRNSEMRVKSVASRAIILTKLDRYRSWEECKMEPLAISKGIVASITVAFIMTLSPIGSSAAVAFLNCGDCTRVCTFTLTEPRVTKCNCKCSGPIQTYKGQTYKRSGQPETPPKGAR